MAREDLTAIDVFFSYSHKDEELRNQLETHLSLLKREGAIRTWHDRRIGAGREWEGEIDRHLDGAQVVLLLISPDFIASDYCYDRELSRALERHDAGDARVIPILLRPTDWQSASFAKLQALPSDDQAITTWKDRDAAFVAVVRGIRQAIEMLAVERAPEFEASSSATSVIDDLTQTLKRLSREKALLESLGQDTSDHAEQIVGLKRQLREGAQLRKGDWLADRFELLEKIGRGGFAQVWKAYDEKREEAVAVKVLHPQYAADKTRRDRFFRGARQMARLRHSGIVGVIEEQLEDGGFYFFAMGYVGGGDLRQAVLRGRLTLEERLSIVLKVGEALQHAHEQGVIHRDVKPANILLDLDGRPKLTDFDLAKAADTTGGTRTSSSLGTFVYAAPEAMVDAGTATVQADVFSLGMTLLFAINGADLPPVVVRRPSRFLASLEIPQSFLEVIERAIEWEVEDRWGTVRELCDALCIAQADMVSASSPETTTDGEVVELATPARPLPAESPIREKVHEKDGSVLVYVPGGDFTLGSDEIDAEEKPVHCVRLSPFWIGKYPVTNAQYERFLKAHPGQAKPAAWDNKSYNEPAQPVVSVSWREALAYCRWAGLTLPTEAQWEAAARGTDARPYPWGDAEPSRELANFGRNEGRPTPVGAYPKGTGPYGTLDQAGNVWEWCRDVFDEVAYRDRDGKTDPIVLGREDDEGALRVLRGGSWGDPSWDLCAAIRYRFQTGSRYGNLGFRVVLLSVPEHGS